MLLLKARMRLNQFCVRPRQCCRHVIALLLICMFSSFIASESVAHETLEDEVLPAPALRKRRQTNVQSTPSEASWYQNYANNAAPSSRFAYAFLAAGIDPRKPSYMSMFYGILVANQILRESGTLNDVIVMVRMSKPYEDQHLPPEVEDLLTNAGLKVLYLPVPTKSNFYTAIMDKFRVLQLVPYERILFLDADVMPLCNLDYIFDLSVSTPQSAAVLRPNLILATIGSPADAGFFMLPPNLEDYQALRRIVEEREGSVDAEYGWGHKIVPPDQWVSDRNSGTEWNFYGSFADQGLLYHWVKYVKKDATIINKSHIETWGILGNGDNTVPLQQNQATKLDDSRVLLGTGCTSNYHITGVPAHFDCPGMVGRYPPNVNYVHFCNKLKPWLYSAQGFLRKSEQDGDTYITPHHMWFQTLYRVLEEYEFQPRDFALNETWGLNTNLGYRLSRAQIPKRNDA